MTSNHHNYLSRERRKWELSQRELALLIGLKSRAQISEIERGNRPPTVQILLACQTLFGLTAAQLFPQLVAETDDIVMFKAQALYDSIKTIPTLRAQGKRDLLLLALQRAISRSPND